MKYMFLVMSGILCSIIVGIGCENNISRLEAGEKNMSENIEAQKLNPLTPEEERIIVHKGTESPYTGKYNDHFVQGIYTCKRCDAMLYRSQDKFKAHCGWPAFDDELPGAVKRIPDADGVRTEIVCAACGGHLGHVFVGEGLTQKNTRHCVNSLSMGFIPQEQLQLQKAIFAGGCFWGIEHYMQKQPGVIATTVGYIGGHKENPTYKEVCDKTTGHAEAVEVIYAPKRITFEKLARLFFEIHDPTQVNRQGPDIGSQYRSEIFYVDEQQKKTAEKLIALLQEKGYNVATKITKAQKFWPGEEYHQDFYRKRGGTSHCHFYTKRF